ncbi:hypothetical protein KVT40_008421 [Elsinoe batatas]|uniref:Pheromone a factor receptor n=1 Tax=Elsinoe batatas TaxID=2601811 RepID=A0A8K0P9I0_9PEZI|nr:hypothetical protein KVT40_008421 [Elsinoe batatas]
MDITQLSLLLSTTPYPLAILLAILSALSLLLTLPPLIWHAKHTNLAPTFLTSLILLTNLFNLLNALLWPNDHLPSWPSGKIYCDLHVKFTLATSTALPSATLCILRKLALVLDTDNLTITPTPSHLRRTRLAEIALCFIPPIATMISHFLVQPTRYAIVGIAGCTPSLSNTWLSALLIILPPALLALVNVYYALLILVPRFVRLYLLALGFVFLIFPVTLYLLFQNWPRDPSPFDWGRVHDYEAWKQIAMVPCLGSVGVDKWMQVVAGGLVFGLFGVGSEARGMYKGWLTGIGLGGVVRECEALKTRMKGWGRGSAGSMGADGRGRGRLSTSFSFGSGLGRKGSHGSANKSELGTGTGTMTSSSEMDIDLEMQTVELDGTERPSQSKSEVVVSVVPVSGDRTAKGLKVGRMSVPRWAGVFKGKIHGITQAEK